MNFESAATRVYVLTLRAFPRRHREAYAAQMIETFERELSARKSGGGALHAMRFAVAAWFNVIGAGIGERQRLRRTGATGGAAMSWLDVVLAWRMLGRYPGLSIISVFAMAVGIAIAAGSFTVVRALMNPAMPLAESDRVVSLLNWDAATTNRELRLLYDYRHWQRLTTVAHLGAARTVERTLLGIGAAPQTVTVAEMSASGFDVARVSPRLGRYLLPNDERPDASDVLVIGYDEWMRRFSGDQNIVGRTLQLGSTTYTIVGVMPEGFAFPVNHSFWIPWRLDSSTYEPRSGPVVNVFARLAPGATLESAQAELTALGERLSAETPRTHQHLRARVLPYTYAFNDMDDPDNALALTAIQMALVMLLLVVYVNVAILVYARTATREGEIAVRSALGASRLRIVTQLFVEALMLAGVASALGTVLLSFVFRRLDAVLFPAMGPLPFWMTFRLSTEGVLYVVLLTLLAAAIVGGIPALKATGRRVQGRLRTLSAGSGSGLQMGRLWTTLIVAQVALTVALLPAAMLNAWSALRFRSAAAGFSTSELLTAQLVLDRAAVAAPGEAGEDAFKARYAAAQRELERRVRSESAVADITFSMAMAGQELALVLEVEGLPAPIDLVDYNIVEGTKRGHLVRFNRVAPGFFDVLDAPIVMGRGFQPGDLASAAAKAPGTVLVGRTMVDTIFAGANPVGRRIKYVGRSREADARDVELDRWHEIVGVVPDVPVASTTSGERVSRVYHAVAPGDVYPAQLAIRVRGGDPAAFAGTLRELGAAVDPNLQLRDVTTAVEAAKREQGVFRLIGAAIVVVMLSVVVLSAAGIYALMSFTVSRRRREIGIRAALGAEPTRVLAGILSRAFGQLALGALVGLAVAVGLEQVLEGETFHGQGAVVLPMVAVFMTAVGVLAALGPARRGLAIQPTEALRDE